MRQGAARTWVRKLEICRRIACCVLDAPMQCHMISRFTDQIKIRGTGCSSLHARAEGNEVRYCGDITWSVLWHVLRTCAAEHEAHVPSLTDL